MILCCFYRVNWVTLVGPRSYVLSSPWWWLWLGWTRPGSSSTYSSGAFISQPFFSPPSFYYTTLTWLFMVKIAFTRIQGISFFLVPHIWHCTEGWECDLGFWGLKFFFLPIMVWGASLDPTVRYSTMEPSGISFRGSQQLSEVGLVVKKWLKSGEKSIAFFCPKNV